MMQIPAKQKMERQESLAREHSEEHKAAMRRAVALDIPQAYTPLSYGTFHEMEEAEFSGRSSEEVTELSSRKRRESWDEFVERLFEVDESGHMVFKKSVS